MLPWRLMFMRPSSQPWWMDAKDYAGAAALQYQQQAALREVEPVAEGASDEKSSVEGSDTEKTSNAEERSDKEAAADTRVLKMLYKGNMEEISRQEQQHKNAKVYNRKHNCYRNTR